MIFVRALHISLACVASSLAVDTLVDVSYTRYQGTANANGVSQWLGMRFAAPPLGDLRFAPPQDPLFNSSIQSADEHGLICLGTGNDPTLNTTSEDCLFLDVYAPSNATYTSKLPVFFFIQGGGFNDNTNANYNGSGLITASGYDIVVVNFNYRVGPYGFIASQEVQSSDSASVNNGLKDQLKALEWVQQYISRFGGDPEHVTIGGDSSGAASVTLLLTAYGGKDMGLFHASAAESQSFATVLTVNESQYQYNNFVIRTECASASDTLVCLRNKTAVELQTQNFNNPYPGAQMPPLFMWDPVIDNDLIQDYTYRAFNSGSFIRVPVIFGDDTNGGTIFTPRNTSNISGSDIFLQDQFPYLTLQDLATINSLYPETNETYPNSGPYWRQVSNAYGEMRYRCPGLFISSAFSRYNVSANWNYWWNVEDPAQIAEGEGVPHTVELNAIWGPENVNGGAPESYYANGTNAGIVPVVQGYWTSFIKSYNPNTYRLPGTPTWEEWTVSGQNWLMFQTNNTKMDTVDTGLQQRCAFLESIGLSIRQ